MTENIWFGRMAGIEDDIVNKSCRRPTQCSKKPLFIQVICKLICALFNHGV